MCVSILRFLQISLPIIDSILKVPKKAIQLSNNKKDNFTSPIPISRQFPFGSYPSWYEMESHVSNREFLCAWTVHCYGAIHRQLKKKFGLFQQQPDFVENLKVNGFFEQSMTNTDRALFSRPENSFFFYSREKRILKILRAICHVAFGGWGNKRFVELVSTRIYHITQSSQNDKMQMQS